MKRPDEITPMTPEQSKFFAQFYEENHEFLWTITKKFAECNDWDDVAQESWWRLMKNVESVRERDIPGRRGYIVRTVRSANEDLRRSKDPNTVSWEDYILCNQNTLDTVSDLHRRDQLELLRQELPPRDWYALIGKYYYKYSDEELGQKINVQSNSLRMILHRIRRKSQKILYGGSLTGGGGNER